MKKKKEKNKLKTNRSAAKRFKKTGTGKIKRWHGEKSHYNAKMRAKRKRRLRSPEYLEGREARELKKLVPYI